MRSPRLFLVQASAMTGPLARTAARRAFSGADIIEVATVDEAARGTAASPRELLVLTEPDPSAVAAALRAVDASGLPRWGVVILGEDLGEVAETVPPEDWNAPLIARVFRSALLQHELLRENSRLQGDLRTVARRISHDLYTPIGCIYTCAHVLKITLSAAGVPSNAIMVGNIEESLVEIAQIIDRVSFLLRASADPIAPVPCDMAGVVAEVLNQLEPHLLKAGATVTQPPSWPEVQGVPPWLREIWRNLLTNSLKHAGPQAAIRLGWTDGEDGYRFSVADRGAAIEPVTQAVMFRPFDQLHLLHGRGLGLSIVQRLVALQGGRCGYERLDDGSSEFFFTIPSGADDEQEGQDSPPDDAQFTPPPQGADDFSSGVYNQALAEKTARPAGAAFATDAMGSGR